MKKLMISALLASTIASTAWAQQNTWTGFYAGARAGYGFGDSRADLALGGQWATETQGLRDAVTNGWSGDLKPKGPLLGLHGGYNHQITNMFVLGAEADFTALNADDASNRTVSTPFVGLTYAVRNEIDVKRIFSLRAKAGLALSQQTLLYVTGGWAWARAEAGAEVLSSGAYSKASKSTHSFDGFIVGGGVEHKITNRFSVRLDYTYSDLGDVTFSTLYRAGSTFVTPAYTETFRQDLKMHQVSVGFNYRF